MVQPSSMHVSTNLLDCFTVSNLEYVRVELQCEQRPLGKDHYCQGYVFIDYLYRL